MYFILLFIFETNDRFPRATTALNNQYVSLKTGQTTYSLGPQASAAKFFFRKYDPTGTWSFYNSDDTRQVALLGANSILLNFVDFTSPSADKIPGGQFMEWGTFTTDNNLVGVKDGSTLTNRTFVGVKGSDNSYTVAFYDGTWIDSTIWIDPRNQANT